MPTYDWITVLGCAAKLSATTVGNTTTKATMASEPLPTGILNIIGRNLRVRAWGYYSTDAATPGTLAVALQYGSTATVLSATSATLPGAETNRGWEFKADVTTLTTGSTGTVFAHGKFSYFQGVLDAHLGFGLVNTAAVTVDVTGVVTPTLAFTRSVADADNTSTCAIFLCDVGGDT